MLNWRSLLRPGVGAVGGRSALLAGRADTRRSVHHRGKFADPGAAGRWLLPFLVTRNVSYRGGRSAGGLFDVHLPTCGMSTCRVVFSWCWAPPP
jgi:hypothetical protein